MADSIIHDQIMLKALYNHSKRPQKTLKIKIILRFTLAIYTYVTTTNMNKVYKLEHGYNQSTERIVQIWPACNFFLARGPIFARFINYTTTKKHYETCFG